MTSTAGEPKPLLGQFAWVTAGRIVAAILQAASLVLVVQRVSPVEFGVLSTVLGLATVFQTTVDMGVATFITRERALNPESGGIATALRFNAITSALLAVVVFALLGIAGSFDPIYLLLLPLALWVSAERNADARLGVVFADGDAKINVFNLVGRRALAILVFVLLANSGMDPLFSFAVSSAVAAICSSLFANIYVKRRPIARPTIGFRELLRESRPYWINSVATQARNLDVTITVIMAGAAQAGFYSTAARLTSPLRILPNSLSSVLLPAATRASRQSQSMRPLLRVVVLVTLIMTGIYAAIWMLVPTGVSLFLGAAYTPAVPSIQIVVASLPFAAAASLLTSMLQGRGEKRYVAAVATVTTVLCLSAVAVAAPSFGSIGASAALAGSFIVQALALSVRLGVIARRGNEG